MCELLITDKNREVLLFPNEILHISSKLPRDRKQESTHIGSLPQALEYPASLAFLVIDALVSPLDRWFLLDMIVKAYMDNCCAVPTHSISQARIRHSTLKPCNNAASHF